MGPVTFINVFELDPADADEFIEGWKERAEFMRTQPGPYTTVVEATRD